MAPEYVVLGQFSVKSDVFSFGVLVLEIISGQRNNFRNGDNIQYFLSYVSVNMHDELLATWAYNLKFVLILIAQLWYFFRLGKIGGMEVLQMW